MYGKSNMETYLTICKTDSQQEFAVLLRKLKQGLCVRLEGWDGRGCFIDYAKAFDCIDHNKLWKILKNMGIPDHLTCLLRYLYAGQ